VYLSAMPEIAAGWVIVDRDRDGMQVELWPPAG
jgi:hypothetical protein